MKISSIEIVVLEPLDPENWLTDGAGVYSKKVFLGANDTPERWGEITDQEKTQAEAAADEGGGN